MMEQKEQREKIYLSSPTMHGEEQKFVAEAFDTNWVCLLYTSFAFFPVIQMYVLCSAKDTLYSAGMLLVIVLLLQLFEAVSYTHLDVYKRQCISFPIREVCRRQEMG